MSKELEALKTIKEHLPTLHPEEYGLDNIDGCFGPSKECQYQLDTIETALKAFEIIKEKGISTCSVALHYGSYEEYSKSCFRQYNPLTQKEYDLLKEVLL